MTLHSRLSHAYHDFYLVLFTWHFIALAGELLCIYIQFMYSKKKFVYEYHSRKKNCTNSSSISIANSHASIRTDEIAVVFVVGAIFYCYYCFLILFVLELHKFTRFRLHWSIETVFTLNCSTIFSCSIRCSQLPNWIANVSASPISYV